MTKILGDVAIEPWGREYTWAKTDRYIGRTLNFEGPGQISLRYHRSRESTVMLLFGKVALTYFMKGDDAQVVELELCQPFCILPKMRHQMVASEASCVLVVSSAERDDVVLLEDR